MADGPVGNDHVPAALAKFAQQPESASYTDCMVMAVADAYATRAIFGFDRLFAQAGYERLTPASVATMTKQRLFMTISSAG